MSYFHTPSVALDCMVMHVRDLPALCLSAWLLLFAIEIPPPDVTFLCVVVEPFRMADKSKPAIRVSLRNFMTNRLLCRKQFVCEVEHPGRGTVHKKELQTKISQMFKIQVLHAKQILSSVLPCSDSMCRMRSDSGVSHLRTFP